jgi:hypothetical protein
LTKNNIIIVANTKESEVIKMAIIYNFSSYYAIKKEREELKKEYEKFMSEVYPKLTEEDIHDLYNTDDLEFSLEKILVKHRLKEYFLIV